MTAAEVEQLLRDGRLRATQPDPETALVELESARTHVSSAEKIVADDPEAALALLYDAMRKAIVAHMLGRHRVAGERAPLQLQQAAHLLRRGHAQRNPPPALAGKYARKCAAAARSASLNSASSSGMVALP